MHFLELKNQRLEKERARTISALRTLCELGGDNDWPDDLYIPDIVEKHLYRNMDETIRQLETEVRTLREEAETHHLPETPVRASSEKSDPISATFGIDAFSALQCWNCGETLELRGYVSPPVVALQVRGFACWKCGTSYTVDLSREGRSESAHE